jgi:hypothetical protein
MYAKIAKGASQSALACCYVIQEIFIGVRHFIGHHQRQWSVLMRVKKFRGENLSIG